MCMAKAPPGSVCPPCRAGIRVETGDGRRTRRSADSSAGWSAALSRKSVAQLGQMADLVPLSRASSADQASRVEDRRDPCWRANRTSPVDVAITDAHAVPPKDRPHNLWRLW